MNLITPDELNSISTEELRSNLIDMINSLTDEQAQELYKIIMDDDNLKRMKNRQN